MHSHYCENLHDCQLITLVLCLIVNESNNIGRSSNYSNFVNKGGGGGGGGGGRGGGGWGGGGGGLRFKGEGYSKLQKDAYSEPSLISKTNVFSKTVKGSKLHFRCSTGF